MHSGLLAGAPAPFRPGPWGWSLGLGRGSRGTSGPAPTGSNSSHLLVTVLGNPVSVSFQPLEAFPRCGDR